jgi:hypothetical protein
MEEARKVEVVFTDLELRVLLTTLFLAEVSARPLGPVPLNDSIATLIHKVREAMVA